MRQIAVSRCSETYEVGYFVLALDTIFPFSIEVDIEAI
jgi:hypothetical protein